MKQPGDRNELLREVLRAAAHDDLRDASLEECLAQVRAARRRRQSARIIAGIALPLLILAGVLAVQNRRPARAPVAGQVNTASIAPRPTVPGTPIAIINDDQLLDLFKGRPIALVGPPGQQRLVLLDESAD